ncbi:MAG: hypothetical protein AAF641_07810 [Pseudomonadota bacterium]
MPSQKYLDTLKQYYEEEVEGEAYFAEAARHYDDPLVREKLELLAECERHAAEAVAPLIRKYALTPKPAAELQTSGRKDAQDTEVDWDKMVAGMNETYPGYLNDFKGLEALGPVEDQQRLNFLTEHEVAAIEFLRLEAIDPDISAAPLKDYLATDPGDWVIAAE